MDKALINIITIMETAITLSARLIFNSMPATLRLLSRETLPSNLIPGVDADKVMVRGTGALCFSEVAPTASWSPRRDSSLVLSGVVGAGGSFFRAGVVIRSHNVVL